MSKLNAGKVSLWVIIASAFLGAFFLGKAVTKISAITVDPWSCQSNGPQCGTNNGTEKVCPTDYTRDSDTCKKWVDAVYTCVGFTQEIRGVVQNVSEFYEKKVGDNNHCHKIVWNKLTSGQQSDFTTMNGGAGNVNDYNSTINPDVRDALTENGTGIYLYADPITQSCVVAGDPRYDSCPVDCVLSEWSACSASCGGGVQTRTIVTDPLNDGAPCGELSQSCNTQDCEIDQCTNIDEFQSSVPDGYYQTETEKGLMCYAKTAVCNDQDATNYERLTDETYADNSLCTYPTPVPGVTDICANIAGDQTSVPEGMHLDASGKNCVNFSDSGPAPRNDEGQGQVLGASTQGQVLGASTMAKTGSFEETLFQAIMGIGATISAFGLKGLKKAQKASKK